MAETHPLGSLGTEYLLGLLATNVSGGLWTTASSAPTVKRTDDIDKLSYHLADLFDRELRYVPRNDQWHKGRPRFVDQIRFFVSRNLPLHFVLPAFPCKSSNNIDKTLGTLPDMGELLALQSLNSFNEKVHAVYAPGSMIVIVSDGHVFSDLIGVADDTVDEYGRVLRAQANAEFPPSSFDFHGLNELLTIKSCHLNTAEPLLLRQLLPSLTSVPLTAAALSSHQSSPQADDARRALDTFFGSADASSNWKHRLATDPATIALYRGFSKFLLADLAHRPEFTSLSKTQRKKQCCALAYEMIKRNEAYSAMVELLFPMHLRISIHPHSCAGPKMGVRLISPAATSTNITSPSTSSAGRNSAPSEEAHFHIPTPWHNTVLETASGRYVLYKRSEICAGMMMDDKSHRLALVRFPDDGRPSHYRIMEAPEETKEEENIETAAGCEDDGAIVIQR
ncbi:dityrosine synthesis enzyme [Geranomyces michiganensis]|nr:dityrosine synthesis enzyme [Geranomyces michiganensis]